MDDQSTVSWMSGKYSSSSSRSPRGGGGGTSFSPRKITSNTQLVPLKTKDGSIFQMSRDALMMSSLLSSLLEIRDYHRSKQEIPVEVEGKIFAKVVEYCEHYIKDPMDTIEKPLPSPYLDEFVDMWYVKFIKVDHDMLFELLLVANYLDVPPLLDLGSAAIAALMKGKSTEEIRQTFNIENDFTPEEEEQVIAESHWLEDA